MIYSWSDGKVVTSKGKVLADMVKDSNSPNELFVTYIKFM